MHLWSRQRSNSLSDLHALAICLFVRVKIGKGAAQWILGRQIDGIQQITFFCSDTTGQTIDGKEILFRSVLPYESARVAYEFTGTADPAEMSGDVSFGEYGRGRWSAKRL